MRELIGTIIRRRPFVPIALFFAAGIVAGRVIELSLRGALILLCLSIVTLLPARSRLFALSGLLFALGASLYSARFEIISENDLRLIFEEKPALISLRGRLLETPALRDFPGRTNIIEYSYARIDVTEVLFERKWRTARGVVASTTAGVLSPDMFKGRHVEINGVISRPKSALAPAMFDFRQYLHNSRIFYQLHCESTNDWVLTSFEPIPLSEKFQRWAHDQLARGLSGKDESLEMVRAMALGTNTSLNGEIADVFMTTGTLHIFAKTVYNTPRLRIFSVQ